MAQREYVPISDAIRMPGLRLVVTSGVPGPWSVAAKAMFDVKGIPYALVEQRVGEANEELKAWTGHGNAPTAMYDDERARSHWSELLMLAELLRPEPALIPADEDGRAAMFGLCHELCGEDGFGWSARTILFAATKAGGGGESIATLERRYGDGRVHDHGRDRLNAVLGLLVRRLEAQRAIGSDFLFGDRLSAADIYWTAFSNIVAPMEAGVCPMPDSYRDIAKLMAGELSTPLPAILIEHRDRILRGWFDLPIWF